MLSAEKLIQLLGLFEESIQQMTLFKNAFNDQLGKASDRQIINQDVEKVTLLGVVNETTSRIPAYADDNEPVNEVIYLYIRLKTQIKASKAFKVIASTMPYHMVAVTLSQEGDYQLHTGNYHLKQNGFLAIQNVNSSPNYSLEDFVEFAEKIQANQLPKLNLQVYYQAIQEAINAEKVKKIHGVDTDKVNQELMQVLESLNLEAKQVASKIQSTKQLNLKMEYMQEYEKITQEIKQLMNKIEERR